MSILWTAASLLKQKRSSRPPLCGFRKNLERLMVGPDGFEPSTSRLSAVLLTSSESP